MVGIRNHPAATGVASQAPDSEPGETSDPFEGDHGDREALSFALGGAIPDEPAEIR